MLPKSVAVYSKLILLILLIAGWSTAGHLAAQTFSQGDCTVSVLNQTANVLSDGTWNLPNVPSNMGAVRARVTCEDGDQVLSGASDFFEIVPDRMNAIPRIELGSASAVPESITLDLPVSTLTSPGQTVQAAVTARFVGGGVADVTPAVRGTTYLTSNPDVATVGPDGRITAVGSGRTLVAALHEAILDSVLVTAILSPDSDGDGLPDDFELAVGLDPQDPVDALEDLDGDGLNNLQEFELGTRLDDRDSDGDGLADGEEVTLGRDGFVTNPLLVDSDGDGVRDGLEISVGTDPTDRDSVDYEAVLVRLTIEPAAFTLIHNTLLPDEVSRRVRLTGLLIDETEADLTTRPEVTYRSSDLQVASLGAEPGRVFAGQDGTTVVTATLAGFSAQAQVRVTTVSPQDLAFLPLPGFPNGVAAGEDVVYVATGATGLHVVDVTDPSTPFILGSLDTPGNANDVRATDDGLVYVADGDQGLQIIDASLPESPVLLGSVDTPGIVTDLALDGGLVWIADGEAGVAVIDVTDPASPRILAQLDTPGNARGIDADGGLAVVADATGGIHVVDWTDPVAPVLTGSTHTRGTTSHAADVALRGRQAYVADGSDGTLGGLKVIDLTDPTTPAVVGATDNGFGLTGIALDRNLALAADYFFVNAVPAFDIRQQAPAFRGTVDFSGAPSSRDDNGNGVAVREGLVFLAGVRQVIQDNGTSANGGLHIGRYALLGDDFGIAPEVELTAPVEGATVFERQLVTLQATASDDILVDAVTFRVDGEPVGGDFSPPYEVAFQVPGDVTELVIQAMATDLGGNQAVGEEVVVTAVPDDDPTVRIVSPLPGSSGIEGSNVEVSVSATDDEAVTSVELRVDGTLIETRSTPPFRFSVPIPSGRSEVTLTATATDGLGQTASDELVLTVIPDQPPVVEIVEPLGGQEIIEGGRTRILVGVVDDVGVAAVRFFVDGLEVEQDLQEPFEHELAVPTGVGQVAVSAEATDSMGQTAVSTEIVLPVIEDPGTTLVGSLVTEDGFPVAGATVTSLEITTTSLGDGSFRLERVPTIHGPIGAQATDETQGLQGTSAFVTPVPGGVVDVGILLMRPQGGLGMVVDDFTKTVVVFDSQLDTVVGAVPIGNGSAAGDCSVTADETLGFATNFAGELWVIDLTTSPPSLAAGTNPIFLSNPGEDTSITPDEQFVVVCDGGLTAPVSVVDIEARREVSTFTLGTDCNSVDVCSDGSVLVTSTFPGVLRRLTIDDSGTLSDTGEILHLPLNPINVDCEPGAASGVATLVRKNVVAFAIPGLTETSLGSMSGFFGISAAFHPFGQILYTRSNFGGGLDLLTFDPLRGLLGSTPQRTVPLRDARRLNGVDQMAVGPDGTKVYVSQPGALNVYDAVTGELLTQIIDPALVEPTGVCFPQRR